MNYDTDSLIYHSQEDLARRRGQAAEIILDAVKDIVSEAGRDELVKLSSTCDGTISVAIRYLCSGY